jgi:phosphodiesterase/alkaline phosphatase D-like protein
VTNHALDRRTFLTLSAAGAATLATTRFRPAGAQTAPGSGAPGGRITDPFTLGVASGDPTPGGEVLWTRLAPDPVHGGGMPDRPVPVQWEPPEVFLARRAAAFQAYYEHMPLRRSSVADGMDMQLYRRLTFGNLLDLHLLDTRQYRSDQNQVLRLDPDRTILGDDQERWLTRNLAGDTARPNVLAQQVFFSQRDFTSGPN